MVFVFCNLLVFSIKSVFISREKLQNSEKNNISNFSRKIKTARVKCMEFIKRHFPQRSRIKQKKSRILVFGPKFSSGDQLELFSNIKVYYFKQSPDLYSSYGSHLVSRVVVSCTAAAPSIHSPM